MTLEYQNLSFEMEGAIGIITINRPKYLNALNKATMGELKDFFSNDYKKVEGLKGVIITGAGEKSFVAGADISEFNNFSEEDGKAYAKSGQETFFLIERFQLPVIAAVNGFSLGGGCELAMACHFRIASPNAKFGQPEVNLALVPGFGGTQRLPQLIGKGKAFELLMTGDMISAAQALSLGLVNHVVDKQEELMAFVSKMMNKILSKGPVAITKVIESVNANYDASVDGYEVENKSFGITIGTEDSTEGATAFLEKRKANFKGS